MDRMKIYDTTLRDGMQAEGISFEEDGDMYISNEGGDGKGNILKFKHKQ